MPGLINLPAPPTDQVATYQPQTANAVQAASKSYEPKGFAVTSDQTVAGQLEKIVASDSPLLQQARTRAHQEMNARGLINSSLTVGAAQDAVVKNALPIAQQDAKTYETANTNTTNAQNAALNFGAQADNTASLQNAQQGTNVNLANADAANKAGQLAAADANQRTTTVLNNQNQQALAQMDNQTRSALATMDGQYRQLLQSNQNAANMYNRAVENIASISMSNTMSQDAKDAAVASQLALLNEQLRVTAAIAKTEAAAVASLDLSQYFTDLGPPPAPNTPPSWVTNPPAWYSQPPTQEPG